MIQRVKGTQDFIDLRLFNFFLDNSKKFLKIYNFKQGYYFLKIKYAKNAGL